MSKFERIPNSAAIEYNRTRPALLFGNDPEKLGWAEAALVAAGVRLAPPVPILEAASRLEEQASLGLAWLELSEENATPQLETVLRRLNDFAAIRGTRVIASVPLSLVDMVSEGLTDRATEILVDPGDAERAAAIAVALSRILDETGVRDIGSDDAARLRRLSDEMGRIAATMARLSTSAPGAALKPVEYQGDAPPVSAETIREIQRARRLRSRYFEGDLFADPAWDMMLDLLQAEITQIRVTVSALCMAAAVPATTALRWIKSLTEQGLFVRNADPTDGRRVFIELAPAASEALRRYFGQVGKPVAI